MPPSSSRRVGLRSRREPDAQQHSDQDTPESINTPSRKRRRLNGSDQTAAAAVAADPPRARITESVASNDSNETLPNGADDGPSDPVERQLAIINALRTPVYTPMAAIDYANELQEKKQVHNIPAFAKIAARDWSFFVKNTRVIIGRVDAGHRNAPADSHPPSQSGLPASEDGENPWGIDIDLGPERQVSRVHAQIDFNPSDQVWYIRVNSRNGLKLDNTSLNRGECMPLHSGICIGIMGTQMLFLLANQEDRFHDMLWAQVKNDPDGNESDNDGNRPHRLPHAHPSGPTPQRQAYNPFPPSSHPRNQQQSSLPYNNDTSQLTSTPGRPPPSSAKGSKTSPAYPRGMMVDSIEDIDYSADSAKELKPHLSYAQLIGQAILSSPDEMLTLNSIYEHIKKNYSFFRHNNRGWQNSIRHNLSLNKVFEKVARRSDEPGKGMNWRIADSEREEFIRKQINPARANKAGMSFGGSTSGPSSPAVRQHRDHHHEAPSQATERLMGAVNQQEYSRIKSPPRSATPPITSFPSANESYTPDRGPRQNAYGGSFKQSPSIRDQERFVTPAKRLFDNGRESAPAKPTQHLTGLESSPVVDPTKPRVTGMKDDAANSPPTLYSDTTVQNHDASKMNNALVTPLPSRYAPRLAPPSTAQVPSHYMNFSSPAPFWKYFDIPSTPAKGADISPIKMKREGDEKDVEDAPAQPSSPPMLSGDEPSAEPEDNEEDGGKDEEDEDAGPESPSRTVSRPVSQRDLPVSQRSRSTSNVNSMSNGGMVRGASLASFEEEAEEEAGYDLSQGFQSIGSYHRYIQQGGRPPQPTSVPANM